MIVSLCAKFFGVFLVVVLILRIPTFPKLKTTTSSAASSSGHYANGSNNNYEDKTSSSSWLTSTENNDGEQQQAARVDSIVASSSAFDRDLYRSLLVEPYRSQYPCQPRGIHLSQFQDIVVDEEKEEEENDDDDPDDDDDADYRVSVTVSFLLNNSQRQEAAACGSALAAVVYGRENEEPEGIQLSQVPPLQFQYTSLQSLGLYTSDYIHHITIPNLQAGMERYWYRIIILDQGEEDEDENAKSIIAATFLQSTAGAAATASATTTSTSRRLGESKEHRHITLLGQTETHSFWTPPLPGRPTTLALVGDLGQTINSTKTMAHILQASLDPRGDDDNVAISNLLIAGDLSYADSDPWRWTSWLYLMEPLLRTTLLSTAPGNHEIETDIRNGHEFVPYEYYFRNPNRIASFFNSSSSSSLASPRNTTASSTDDANVTQQDYNFGNSFYSYQHGLARIIVLNSYSDTTVGSVQYTWFVEELKRHAQTRRQQLDTSSSTVFFSKKKTNTRQPPWLIVSFHSPLYTTFLGHVHESQARRMKTAMEPLFVKYGVNLVISGHDHGYMRTHSIRPASSNITTATDGTKDDEDNDSDEDYDSMDNAEIDPTGKSPIYLTLGAAGNREHHAPGYRNPHQQEEWVVVRDLCDYGYGHLHLKNATHARLRWIRDHVVPDNMTISDDVWIVNRHHHYRENDDDPRVMNQQQ
jgi:Calcineurin-like phosphoesterase/Iron/zinc purple acid phosphatase-like protein C